MKNKILVILIVFIFTSSALMFSKEVQQSNWKGKIETKEGVTVVSNLKEPLYGVIELELEEDLVIGEEGDEKFRFFNNKGHYLYRLKVPEGAANLRIFKGRYVFCALYSEDIGYFQVKRYKIKNWDQIKKGL